MTKQIDPKRLRCTALLMAIVTAVTLFPFSALAAEEDTCAAVLEEERQPALVNILASNEDAAETVVPAQNDAPETDGDDPQTEEPSEQAPGSDGPSDADIGSEEPEKEGTYRVSYFAGGKLLSEEYVAGNELPSKIPAVVSETGERIVAWKNASGEVAAAGEIPVTEDISYYACLMPLLETKDHIRYISGQGNGNFCPTDSLTRAQAATILYTLLTSDERGPFDVSFTDVSVGAWYYDYVQTLASYGILSGYEDGSFRPNNYVTRAEFVAILVRATGASGKASGFTDIADHWAREDIETAFSRGWISGYEEADGSFTFRPQRYISRAEAVTIVNTVVGRSADEQVVKGSDPILIYLDVSPRAWYYGEVMEASVAHDYTRTEAGEIWINYTPEGTGLEPGVHESENGSFLVNNAGLPVYLNAGINEVEGRYYYASAQGVYFTADLSGREGYCRFTDGTESRLTDGFNLIGNTLFYWDLDAAAPTKLKAGLNELDGNSYWADSDGYTVRNDFDKGVVTLGGKKYLSSGYCVIVTSGLGYRNATSKPTNMDLKGQTYEFEDNMYYIKDDYSLACDEWIGYLYFGGNCAYTTGDATLDGYVWNIVKSFINNNALTKEQKLLKAYYYIRGGEGQNYAASPFRYRKREIAYMRGRYNGQAQYSWIISSANRFFGTKAGMCYEWAAGYLYLARRLGFQSYVVVGSVFQESTRHCWCMIQWDGKWHISDVEIEWGYLAGWYSSQAVYRNLFAQIVSSESYSTYKNPECALTYWVWEE